MKKIIIMVTIGITLSGCGAINGAYNVATNPISSASRGAGNVIGAGFLAARPEQGTYTYPMTPQ